MGAPQRLSYTANLVCVDTVLFGNVYLSPHNLMTLVRLTDNDQTSPSGHIPKDLTPETGLTSSGYRYLNKHATDISASEYLIQLLETGCFTAVSAEILDRIVEYYPAKLTNRLLIALLPPYAREINLFNCKEKLTLMGLVEGLKKCAHLQRLNLQNCSQLLHADLFTLVGLMNDQLTTLVLEGNQNITDDIVQAAIRALPNLMSLNISCCSTITDDVFLLDPVLQLKRETSQKPVDGSYNFKLSSVDMSGISSISSVAVRHLTSLCGPNLRQLNLAWSTVDSTVLFYLAGFNFPTVIDLVLGMEPVLRKEKELKQYLTELKEIKELYSFKRRGEEEQGKDFYSPKTDGDDNSLAKYPNRNTKQAVNKAVDKSGVVSVDHCETDDTRQQGMSGNMVAPEDVDITVKFDGSPPVLQVNSEFESVGGDGNMLQSDEQVLKGCSDTLSLRSDNTTQIMMVESLNSNVNSFQNDQGCSNTVSAIGDYNTEVPVVEIDSTDKDLSLESLTKTALEAAQRISDFVKRENTDSSEESLNDSINTDVTTEGANSNIVDTHVDFTENIAVNIKSSEDTSWETADQNSSVVSNSGDKDTDGEEFVNKLKQRDEDDALVCMICSNLHEQIAKSKMVHNQHTDNQESPQNLIHQDVIKRDTDHDIIGVCKSQDLPDSNQGIGAIQFDLCDNTYSNYSHQSNSCKTHSEQYVPRYSESKACDTIDKSVAIENEGLTFQVDSGNENSAVIGNKDNRVYQSSCDLDNGTALYGRDEMPSESDKTGESINKDDFNDITVDIEEELDRYISESLSLTVDKTNQTGKLETSNKHSPKESGLISCNTMGAVDSKTDDIAETDVDTTLECAGSSVLSSQNSIPDKTKGTVTTLQEKTDESSNLTGEAAVDESSASNDKLVDQRSSKPVSARDKRLGGGKSFKPGLISLDITNIKFINKKLGQLCLKTFLVENPTLQKFEISWKGLTEDFFKDVLPNLHGLQDISLEECTFIQNGGLAALLRQCQQLKNINLRGVVFIKDMAMTPLYSLTNLTKLNLAESEITDATLFRISNRCCEKLTELDLSWCEGITEKGINYICLKCTQLQSLVLRTCPVSNLTLQVMAKNCGQLTELNIDSVEGVSSQDFSDSGLIDIAENLWKLQTLDISWNLSITNVAVSALMRNLTQLKEVHMKGLKQITCTPFLPIISGVTDENGQVKEFWVDEYCNNIQTAGALKRSTNFVPNLNVLDLEYSDLVEDKRLELIVKVCRGSLEVTDYYGRQLVPDDSNSLVISSASVNI